MTLSFNLILHRDPFVPTTIVRPPSSVTCQAAAGGQSKIPAHIFIYLSTALTYSIPRLGPHNRQHAARAARFLPPALSSGLGLTPIAYTASCYAHPYSIVRGWRKQLFPIPRSRWPRSQCRARPRRTVVCSDGRRGRYGRRRRWRRCWTRRRCDE